MSQDLILRLDGQGGLHWSVVERATGRRLQAGEAGPEETPDLSAFAGIDRTLVLLPSEDVFLGTIDLPARGEREARQAAPFMIEEALASPLSTTEVIPGPRGEDGRRWVMAADRDRLAAWAARIDAVAVRPCMSWPIASPRPSAMWR